MASDAEIRSAAEAMFCRISTNADPPQTWKEINVMPQHATTVSFYLAHATVALEAAERVRILVR